ncbi:MAG: CRTAC1 family protein [Pseudomonadota bacterium]
MIARRACAALLALGGPSLADPVFEPVAVPDHIYSGGWEHFVGGGVAVFDCDGDALPEIVAAGGTSPVMLLRNLGAMAFVRGDLPEILGATGVYALDLDGDGALDLVVTRVGPNTVLRGDGECGFIVDDMGLPLGEAWTTAFSATWDEGQPVLAFGNYVDRRDPGGPFEVCDDNLVVKDGEEIVLSPGFCALSVLFSDEDRDGVPSLRLSNDRHYYVRGGAEQMWSLEGRFLGPEDGFVGPSIWGMGIASRDISGDGRPDLVLTSMGDQLTMLSTQTGHEMAPFEIGSFAQRPHVGEDGRPSTGWHAEWGDVDNDGDADLFIAKGNVDQMPGMAMADPNNLLLNEGGVFREVSNAAGVASMHRGRGGALADLDLDGRLDLVVVNRRAPMEVWRNLSEAGHAVSVRLAQAQGNRDAVGAWVEVRTVNGLQLQELTIGGGHGGDAVAPLHFGIGAANGAEIRVTWPDGEVGSWAEVEPGPVTIRRPDG